MTNQARILIFKTFATFCCLTLVLAGFQNCAPSHMGFESTSLGSSGSGDDNNTVPESVKAQKFAETLQPVIVNRCSACHGVSQFPMFAVNDALTGMRTIFSNELANLSSPQNSRLVTKILGGHNLFPSSYAVEIQNAVQAWDDAIKAAANTSGDNVLPDVMISSPANNSTVSGTVSVQAVATDNIGVIAVQFLVDGNLLGAEDTMAPYTASWSTTGLTNKSYSLTARARDAAGNIRTSTVVSVITNNTSSDSQAPAATMTAPANNATVTAGNVTISANASDNVGVVGVQFLIDGAALGAEDLTAPYSIVVPVASLTNGARILTARARDAAGNVFTSTARTLNVNNPSPDVTPPTVSITAPLANAMVSATITATATASDTVGVVGVQFLIDGAATGAEDTTSPYSLSINTTTLTNGNHTISARARDAAGNMATSSTVTFSVNNATAGNPNARYSWIATNILPKCTSCHTGAAAPRGILYTSYAETMKTVTASNANNSSFYNETKPGGSMPPGSPLSATEVQAIYDWIQGGALNN